MRPAAAGRASAWKTRISSSDSMLSKARCRQPETGERREDGRDVELDHAGQRSHRQRREDREAEVVLVDPTAKDVNARPERMSLEAEHLAHTVPRTFGRGHFQRLCGRAE